MNLAENKKASVNLRCESKAPTATEHTGFQCKESSWKLENVYGKCLESSEKVHGNFLESSWHVHGKFLQISLEISWKVQTEHIRTT